MRIRVLVPFVAGVGLLALTVVGGPDAGAEQTRLLPGPIHQRLTSTLTAASDPGTTVDPTLTAKIRDRLSKATARGYSVVVDIAGVGRVVRINPSTASRPASTQKLFTTLPLLMDIPDRRLVTEVRAVPGGRRMALASLTAD